jgi:hypothetical protein
MYTGLDEIRDKVADTESMYEGTRIKKLMINDGETAILRFITDGADVILAHMHEMEEVGPKGKRFVKRYCTKEDTGVCEHCSGGDKPKGFLYLWSFVYSIIHARQNPQLDINQNAPRWQPIKIGSQTFYKEEVNYPMVFATKVGKKSMYRNAITGFWQEYGTLGDRDYKWSRNGAGLDTIYTLQPKDPTKKSKEVAEFTLETLPSITDYIVGNPTSMETTNGTKEEVKVAAKGNGSASNDLF